MKNILLLLLGLFIFMPTTQAATYPNEPSNFYGITLGGTLADVQRNSTNLFYVATDNKNNLTTYKSDTANRYFYDTNFDLVTYKFYQNRLLLVQATKLADTTTLYSDSILQQVVAKHGRQSSIDENAIQKTKTYTWMGSNTYLELVYDYYKKEVRLNAYNYPLYRDWQIWLRNQGSNGRTKF